MTRRQVKELDPYLKTRIGEAYIQIRELAKPSNLDWYTKKFINEGNWVKR